MRRRKVLAGLGSLAAGGAAVTGTGAFNFANVERGMNVDVADDSDAFLALNDTSPYADGSGNQLALTFGSNSGVGGSGINENSDYSFTGVFSIKNQGSQPVGVWIEDDDSNDVAAWYGNPNSSGWSGSTLMEGSGNAYALDVGEVVYVNLELLQLTNSGNLPTTINVKADASQGN